ncbi:MAG TPA: class I SAM-dependent methyltransferase [Chthoniobacterales bacterium]
MPKKTSATYGFPHKMLHLLLCPRDASPLALFGERRNESNGIIEGGLRCTQCSAEYRIENGIARLMTDSLTPEDQHEIAIRDMEYDSMSHNAFDVPDTGWRSKLSDRLEIPHHLNSLEPLDNRRVLEFGCGDGRFTMLMAKLGAEILSIDFSIAALQKLSIRLSAGITPTTYRVATRRSSDSWPEHVGLVQADASHFFVPPRSFDRALSATPLDSRDERMRMYRTIADALVDDGRFVASLEHDDLTRRLLGMPMARRYSTGGIFIEHFDTRTVRREASPYFSRLDIRPIRPRVPFIHRLPLKVAIPVALTVGATPGLNQLGEILLISAERPVRPPTEGAGRSGVDVLKRIYRWYERRNESLPSAAFPKEDRG